MSRGVLHTRLREDRRSQERGTSSSSTTVVSTRPPCRWIALRRGERQHARFACVGRQVEDLPGALGQQVGLDAVDRMGGLDPFRSLLGCLS
jgi:hypothetical protein